MLYQGKECYATLIYGLKFNCRMHCLRANAICSLRLHRISFLTATSILVINEGRKRAIFILRMIHRVTLVTNTLDTSIFHFRILVFKMNNFSLTASVGSSCGGHCLYLL